MSNLISCKADVRKGVIVTADGHGCVHFCTSHVDTVLAHSCENKVAKDVASNFLTLGKAGLVRASCRVNNVQAQRRSKMLGENMVVKYK